MLSGEDLGRLFITETASRLAEADKIVEVGLTQLSRGEYAPQRVPLPDRSVPRPFENLT
jgi:hypothetical protein